ncbi:MAG: ABC transporter permease [Promethearchaeota archaeon]
MAIRTRLESYLAVTRISLRNTRQYTVDFLTNFAFFPAQMIALGLVYWIVYLQAWLQNGSLVIGGFNYLELISYLFIALIISRALPRWRLSVEIENDIDRGPLVSYLSKPIDYAGFRFFSELPRSLLYIVFGGLTYLITMFFLPLPMPSLYNFLLFIPFFLNAYLVAFLLVFTTSLGTFWINRQWWLRNLLSLLMVIAGGGLIPLSFFPPSLQLAFSLLPFQYCYYIPAIILQGYYLHEQLLPIAILSFIWLLILWLLARFVWNQGRRRYEGPGG